MTCTGVSLDNDVLRGHSTQVAALVNKGESGALLLGAPCRVIGIRAWGLSNAEPGGVRCAVALDHVIELSERHGEMPCRVSLPD